MLGLSLELRVRVRVRSGLEQFLSVDPGIELGLTVLVTSRRYRQTNSAKVRVRVTRAVEFDNDCCNRPWVRVRISLHCV